MTVRVVAERDGVVLGIPGAHIRDHHEREADRQAGEEDTGWAERIDGEPLPHP